MTIITALLSSTSNDFPKCNDSLHGVIRAPGTKPTGANCVPLGKKLMLKVHPGPNSEQVVTFYKRLYKRQRVFFVIQYSEWLS